MTALSAPGNFGFRPYGAQELQVAIRKNTVKAMGITFVLVAFGIGLGVVVKQNAGPGYAPPMLPGKAIAVRQYEVPAVAEVKTAPAAGNTAGGGGGGVRRAPSAAGTPVPVAMPSTVDLPVFDNAVFDLGGDLESLGGGPLGDGGGELGRGGSNEGAGLGSDIGVEPSSEDFIPVEKEPTVDLGQLQRFVVYPDLARKTGVEGQVVVRVLVNTEGRPVRSTVESSDNSLLDKAAVEAVMKAVFTPAQQNGQPVHCWVSVPIHFRLR